MTTKLDLCMVDLAPGDLGGVTPDIDAFCGVGWPWRAIALKVSEGVRYATTYQGWLDKLWPLAKSAWRDCSYGKTGFRLGYHYLLAAAAGQDGRAYGRSQYDWYQATLEQCGGWGAGDLWPTFDLENGDQPANVSPQAIVDTASGFSERAKEVTGRMVMRYSGSYVRDRGIVNKMGADLLWCAEYGAPGKPAKLDSVIYTAQGYTLANTPFWQPKGDTDPGLAPPGYPNQVPIGPHATLMNADYSACIINGGADPDAGLAWIVNHLHATSV